MKTYLVLFCTLIVTTLWAQNPGSFKFFSCENSKDFVFTGDYPSREDRNGHPACALGFLGAGPYYGECYPITYGSLSNWNSFGVSLWAKLDTLGPNFLFGHIEQNGMCKGSYTIHRYLSYVSKDTIRLGDFKAKINKGEWNHFVWSYTPKDSNSFYVNGQKVADHFYMYMYPNVFCGSGHYLITQFNGAMDDLQIRFDKAYTIEEVDSLYKAPTSCEISDPLGLEANSLEATQPKAVPNPNQGQFVIEGAEGAEYVTLLDLNGQTVSRSNGNTFQNLLTGIYMAEVVFKEGRKRIKVVVL